MPLDRMTPDRMEGFLGVNLRRDPVSLADAEMARIIDADLHTRPGVILLRRGRTPHYATGLDAQEVRRIGRHNNRLYNVAGTTVFRERQPIVTGLDDLLLTTLQAYQPFNDPESWTFIADWATRQKDNGVNVRQWGIDAPTTASTLGTAAGSLTGSYHYRYTYARVTDGNVAHESNPSPVSASQSLSGQGLTATVVASTDPQVTHIRGYRTVAGGSLYLFDQQVPNTGATITSTQADTALGDAVETDNDVPPQACFVTEFQGHFFMARVDDHFDYLYWSKRFRPESWPPDNFLRIGAGATDALQCAIPMTGFLGVFSRLSKYRVSGNASSGFAYAEALNTRGTFSPDSVLATSQGVAFWSFDGIWLTNFIQADQELTTAIQPLFYGEALNGYAPVDWGYVRTFSLAEYKKRLYAGYRDTDGNRLTAVYSQDTGQWYHYSHPARSLYYDEQYPEALLMGGTDGMVYVLENGTDDNGETISLEMVSATRAGGDRFVRKHFEYLRLDVEVIEGTATAVLDVDGTTVHSVTLLPSRAGNKRIWRLPHNVFGYTWALTIRGAVNIYGALMLYAPVEAA